MKGYSKVRQTPTPTVNVVKSVMPSEAALVVESDFFYEVILYNSLLTDMYLL